MVRSLACFCTLTLALSAAPPVPLIFDTDMGNDIDDALALAVIHALESRGEAKLLAVTITKDNRWSGPFVDLVNHFYGRGNIPIGMVKNGKTPQDAPYTKVPSERKAADGKLLYPRRMMDGAEAPEAAALIQQILANQADRSVAVVQVGFSTNLERLLDRPGARELIRRKVKVLSIMAGEFPSGKPEYNVRIDIPAAKKLYSQWPTEFVFSGFEIGLNILYPARSIQEDYGYVTNHPIADAYRNYMKMPYDRPTWDLTSVLYAVRPERGYFSMSARGTVELDEEGRTTLIPSAVGKHRYLLTSDVQRAKVLEALIQLASQPPGGKQ
ncbi:MAG: nucleoside hydrolase [Acidobacteria bacterium]|nr:nucleoside hydrolase [Acidobacteriota bacterium]